ERLVGLVPAHLARRHRWTLLAVSVAGQAPAGYIGPATPSATPAGTPGAAAGNGAVTVRTGQGALRTTCSATLPISTRPSPVRPWVPITTRSAGVSRAKCRIAPAGSPSASRRSATRPG